MTSSLVGSEMCIRDSSVPAVTRTSTGRGNDMGWDAVSMVSVTSATSSWAVSYTHLTLPTICSV
eukprot:10379171-Prorocentrum_lima.AAC.1